MSSNPASGSAGSRRARQTSSVVADHPPPERLLGREDVVRAARRLELRVTARSSARNGLRASSAPSVVGGPWPGVDDRLGRVALDERADRLEQRVPVAAREVGAADRAGEEHVAGEEAAVGVEGDVAGRVARDGDDLERDARRPRSSRRRRARSSASYGADRASRRVEVARLARAAALASAACRRARRCPRRGRRRRRGGPQCAVRDEDRRAASRPSRASSSRSSAASPPGSTTTASGAPRSARTT